MPARLPRREHIAAAVIAPLIVAAGAFIWFQRQAAADPELRTAPPLDAPIRADPAVVTGRLGNDLQYFVRRNGYPEHRAELRLVVDVGSILEAPQQLGLAHAVEHMVFRGTKRFPGRAIDEYLTSVGMRRGSDVNATTSEDETIYRITVPSDRLGVIDTALAILADMAHAATFDPEEARQEAGVVMSEWRSRSHAGQRLLRDRDSVLLDGSPYATNSVIGDTAVLRRFDIAEMRKFYTEWYRPELMAVIAVGDFKSDDVVRLVKRHFGDLPRRAPKKVRPVIPVSVVGKTRAAVLRDAEATGSHVAFWYPRPRSAFRVVGDFRAGLVEELWRGVLSDRLEDASERPGSPILSGGASAVAVVRRLSADVSSVTAVPGREREAVELLVTETARLMQHGVTSADARHRAHELLRDYRTSDEFADPSSDLADGLIDQFLTGRPSLDRAGEFELARDLLPTIRAEDILARARRASIDSGAIVFVTAPASATSIGKPDDLVALAQTTSRRAVPAITDSTAVVSLVSSLPKPGSVKEEKVISDARVFDWTLSNGMRVILKPTRFVYDDIQVRIVGPGGASLASDDDYPSAYLSDGVIASTGVGPLNGTKLGRRLSTSSVSLSPTVSDDAVEFVGEAAPRDLELLFQLIYLHFTAPRADTVAFRRYQERRLSYSRGREADPDAVFMDSISAITVQHHRRGMWRSRRFASAIKLESAMSFWKARTSNASGFTAVFVGDFTLDRVRPLVARYLASLPAGTPEKPRDTGIRFPREAMQRTIVAGTAPRAKTQIILSGPFDGTSEASDALGAVGDVTELALTDYLRERLGGTYGADVSFNVDLTPPQQYRVTIDFDSAPELADSLVAATLGELDRLKSQGPTSSEADKIRATRMRDRDGDLENNNYWATELSWHARMGWPLGTISTHQADEARMTKESLRAACRKYLQTDRFVRVTLLPKPGATPARSGQ